MVYDAKAFAAVGKFTSAGDHASNLEHDRLLPDDSKLLEKLRRFLEGIERTTKWTISNDSSVWQVLLCMD